MMQTIYTCDNPSCGNKGLGDGWLTVHWMPRNCVAVTEFTRYDWHYCCRRCLIGDQTRTQERQDAYDKEAGGPQ